MTSKPPKTKLASYNIILLTVSGPVVCTGVLELLSQFPNGVVIMGRPGSCLRKYGRKRF